MLLSGDMGGNGRVSGRAVNVYRYLPNFATNECNNFVRSVFMIWLRDQKSSRIMRTAISGFGNQNVRDALALVDQTLVANKKFAINGFGYGCDQIEMQIERLPIGFPALQRTFGGGFGRKESYLVIAVQGAGKTVFATQMTSLMAMNGAKVGLISTEHGEVQLEPRIVSSHTLIPFDMIKDGVQNALSRFTAEQMERYQQLRRDLNTKNFNILHWKERDTRLGAALDQVIRQFQDIMGGLDVLALDWIGRTLGKNHGNDPARLRLMMKEVADVMCDMADKHNIVTIDFAQAHVSLGYDKMHIDQTCLSECKNLGENKTGVLGITAFRNQESKEAMSEAPAFEVGQFFYVSKSRKGEGLKVPVRRDFKHQRFTAK